MATRSRRRHAAPGHRKESRRQRVLNVRLLLISLVVVGATCLAGYLWYAYRVNRVAGLFLERAAALEQEGEWNDAAGYLRRYLRFAPNDIDARVRLITALEHTADTAAHRRRLVGLLYETLGLTPDRNDLRRKLAQQLLNIGDFAAAKAETGKLLDSKQLEDQQAARRILALSLRAQARRGGPVDIDQAATALAAALADNPGDVTVASITAALYRDYPQDAGIENAAAQADEIMDRLVEAKPHDSEALLARYSYRRRYGISNARQDLNDALADDPNHIEALLFAANEALSSGGEEGRQAAENDLRRVTELAPADPRSYVALAGLYAVRGEADRALDVLLSGRDKLEANRLELDSIIAGLLLDRNRVDEAEQYLAGIEEMFRQRLPQLTTVGRLRQENVNRILRARVALARDDLGPAVRELNALVAATAQADTVSDRTQRLQAYAMRASIMTKLQRPDLAAADWKQVADQAPQFMDARWKVGAALLAAGRPQDAIEQIEAYLQLPSASSEAWVSLVQSHLQQQLSLASTARNWSEFLAAVEEAKRHLPDRWEFELAEAIHWLSLGDEESKSRALDRLRQLEKKQPNEKVLCERLFVLYQQLQAQADAERVLSHYDELEPNVVRRTTLRAAYWARNGRIEDASKLLTDAAANAIDNDRLELQLVRVTLLLAAQQLDAAHQSISDLIAQSPNESRFLALGLEIALVRQDYATAAHWEKALRAQPNVDNFQWQFYRARRLMGEYAKLDSASQAELGQLIESLRSDRPSWYPVITLAGQLAELRGNKRQAIDEYQSAVDLGDRRPETLQRLVTVLYAEGRFNDANAYLSQMGTGAAEQGRFESLAIAAAVKENRSDAALEMVKKAIARGADDAMHRIWLANLLLLNGDQKGAEDTYRETVRRFPKDSGVWNGLFSYFVRTRQPERARSALERWIKQVPMDEATKHFVLGQGYEALGDTELARQHYQKTIDQNSGSIDARVRLAKLLLSTDAAAAREQFEQILRFDPSHAEARRSLAALLAASGEQKDWDRAVQLLETTDRNDAEAASGSDDRLRAILLARRGRTREERLRNCIAARRILATRVNQSDSAGLDIDRMLLAGVYEQESLLSGDSSPIYSARDALRPLVDRANPPTEYLVFYIQFVLRHLEKQREVSGEAGADDSLREVLADDARLRIDTLKALLKDAESGDRRLVPLALSAQLMVAVSRRDDARQLVNEFADEQLPAAGSDSERAKLYLQLGNLCSSVGFYEDAERWYRRLMDIAPNSYVLVARALFQQEKVKEAVDMCLRAAPDRPSAEAATVLAQLLSAANVDAALDRRAAPLIDSALQSNPDNVALLMSVAVLHVTRNEYDEAIGLFQRVVDLEPNHDLALNNLATLLAERPTQIRAAQQYVERAIAVSGRSPGLMDTLGTILVRNDQHEQAVAALEEAVAGGASDPRYYFHLAVAYQRSGRKAEAREAFESSRKLGLESTILTSGDRELLASLQHDLLTSNYQQ